MQNVIECADLVFDKLVAGQLPSMLFVLVSQLKTSSVQARSTGRFGPEQLASPVSERLLVALSRRAAKATWVLAAL